MGSSVFLDIVDTDGGRLYVYDDEGRLRKTTSFGLNAEMVITFDMPLPEDMRHSCVGIPMDWLDFRLLKLDLNDASAARSVLPFELEGLVVGEPDDYIIDALMKEDSDEVLAVYMNKHRLALLLASVESVGLDPAVVTSLELASCAGTLIGGDMSPVTGDEPLTLEEPQRVDLALEQFDSPIINLRFGEFSYKGDVRRGLRRMAGTLAFMVSIILMLTLALSLGALRSSREAAALEADVLGIYAEIFPDHKAQSARGLSYKVRSKLSELRKKAGNLKNVEALEVMMALQQVMPEGLKASEMIVDDKYVLIKGEAPDLQSIEEMRSSMEGFLGDVKITETGKAVSGQTGFTIRGNMTGTQKEAS